MNIASGEGGNVYNFAGLLSLNKKITHHAVNRFS